MDELIGKKINELKINAAANLLVFFTDDGHIAYEAIGDCCSGSWFNDLIGVDAILGEVINAASRENEVRPTIGSSADGECTQFDAHTLITQKGACQIIYRNESNGYYGGYCQLYYGDLPADLIPITNDWSSDAGHEAENE